MYEYTCRFCKMFVLNLQSFTKWSSALRSISVFQGIFASAGGISILGGGGGE